MGARAWLRAGKRGGGRLTRWSEQSGIALATVEQRLALQLIDGFIEWRQSKQKIGLRRATWISAAQRGATTDTARAQVLAQALFRQRALGRGPAARYVARILTAVAQCYRRCKSDTRWRRKKLVSMAVSAKMPRLQPWFSVSPLRRAADRARDQLPRTAASERACRCGGTRRVGLSATAPA